MKTIILPIVLAALLGFGFAQISRGVDEVHPHHLEYATIRWAGRDNTHVVRSHGNVEFVGDQLAKLKKPDRVDDRTFYMNAVMNAMAEQGYEFVGMTSDEIVMKKVSAL